MSASIHVGEPMTGTETLVATYKAKAPVCLCQPNAGCRSSRAVDFCGPQRTAHRVRCLLLARGVGLPIGIDAAISHALTGEGRGEFDALVEGWHGR